MQYLKQIISAINESISAKLSDQRFQGSEYNGIAISAAQENDNGVTRLMPLLANDYDEEKWVGVDDTFPLRIYHKNNGIGRGEEQTKSVGDNVYVKKEVAQFSIIAYGNRARLRMSPEEMEAAIVSGLPSAIDKSIRTRLSLNSCIIKPVSSIFDPVIVYLAEYRTDKYELGPNALFIKINYNIESTYRTACFNICDCPPVTS